MAGIGELNQTDLHEQLKQIYCGEDGETEVEVDGYVVDVRLPSGIIEIQTRNVGALKRKLATLSQTHHVTLVHPIAAGKYIDKMGADNALVSHRRSPKRGRMEDAFREISGIADLLPNPNLTIEIVLVNVTEMRRDDGKGSWRRRGVSITGRRLEEIVESHQFRSGSDYLSVLPDDLPETFTNRDLCELGGLPYSVAQPITNTLRKMNLLTIAAKKGRALTYRPV